jgi:hypothetical protein
LVSLGEDEFELAGDGDKLEAVDGETGLAGDEDKLETVDGETGLAIIACALPITKLTTNPSNKIFFI